MGYKRFAHKVASYIYAIHNRHVMFLWERETSNVTVPFSLSHEGVLYRQVIDVGNLAIAPNRMFFLCSR